MPNEYTIIMNEDTKVIKSILFDNL